MKRWLHFPLLSLCLWITWMALTSFSWGQALLGLVLAVLLPLGTRSFWIDVPRVRSLRKLVVFTVRVLWDIVIANVEVAILILSPARRLRPGFIELPIELNDEFAIAVLMSTISLTPGTVSVAISKDRRTVLIHAIDVDDQAARVARIKARYERALKEVFEC
jgi:multicomponent K+:H+ antiporter subunit E